MYDKFFLSREQSKIIIDCPLNEILFICGDPGVGKTLLAKEILNDRVITLIDSLFLKNNQDIYDYLLNIIQKRNITMMFQESKCDRGIIIDNLEVFHKHDKRVYKSMINLLKSDNYYGTKMIITCSTRFTNHRSLSRLKFSKLHLKYDKFYFHKIITNISRDKCKTLSFHEKEKLLKESNNNLNTFISILDTNSVIKSSEMDNFNSHEKLTKELITEKMDIKDICRLFISDKITVSLNLLENISSYTTDLTILSDIYRSYVIGDIIDTTCINYNMDDYYCVLTIYKMYLFFRKINNIKYYPIRNNNYISRSLIQVYYQRLTRNFIKTEVVIYPYLYAVNVKSNNVFILEELRKINSKELEFYIKSFNYFYSGKVNSKKIKNLSIYV